jgi:hypothetical protein
MKKITRTELVEHPMEDVLDLEPCNTVVEFHEIESAVPVEHLAYDDKDKEIEQKLEDIYATAMTTVTTITDEIEVVEGKYKARMGEVSATMLNVALAAVKEKRHLKEHKDKLSGTGKGDGPRTVNNNIVVADRNDILRALMSGKDK